MSVYLPQSFRGILSKVSSVTTRNLRIGSSPMLTLSLEGMTEKLLGRLEKSSALAVYECTLMPYFFPKLLSELGPKVNSYLAREVSVPH